MAACHGSFAGEEARAAQEEMDVSGLICCCFLIDKFDWCELRMLMMTIVALLV